MYRSLTPLVVLFLGVACALPCIASDHLLPSERALFSESPLVDAGLMGVLEDTGQAYVSVTFNLPSEPGSRFGGLAVRGSEVHPMVLELANILGGVLKLEEVGGYFVMSGTVEPPGLVALLGRQNILSMALENPPQETASTRTPITSSVVACSPSSTTACIRGGDFAVEVTNGRVAATAFESVAFYFFSSTNWEVLVKVLNGCAINGRYWVFAAGATGQSYSITVRDHRQNPFPITKTFGSQCPVADVEAFSCLILK